MVRKAALGIPPRIKEDILTNDARTLKLFLQNIKERIEDLSSTIENLTTPVTTSVTANTVTSSVTDADTLDGFDSSAFARKAANETITGTWTHTSSVTATQFIETSDRRLKENIKPLEQALDIVKQLEGVSYLRKDTGENEIGFIAQDVQKVLPELVTEHSEYLGINYSRVVAVLVEAMKEQESRIKHLELKLANIERGN